MKFFLRAATQERSIKTGVIVGAVVGAVVFGLAVLAGLCVQVQKEKSNIGAARYKMIH